MTSQEVRKYVISRLRGSTVPFYNRPKMHAWTSMVYIDGYEKGVQTAYDWIKNHIQVFDISSNADLATFKKDLMYDPEIKESDKSNIETD